MKLFVRAAVVVLALSGSAAYTQMEVRPSNQPLISSHNSAVMPTCDPEDYAQCPMFKKN